MSPVPKSFKAEIQRLLIQPGVEGQTYFHVTRLANAAGELTVSVDSHWGGYTTSRPRREIREASPLDGPRRRAELRLIGETCLLVNDETDFRLWLAFGGHAVVLDAVAKLKLGPLLAPREVARDSSAVGFVAAQSLSGAQLQHATSKTLRMAVLTRDGRRCFICGRSPANHVDLELHVHHIVPWGQGGITEIDNLVTLCGTCHDGLKPHFDRDLVHDVQARHGAVAPTYLERLWNYQQCVQRLLQIRSASGTPSP